MPKQTPLKLDFERIWPGGIDHYSDASQKHPGFKAVQAKIAAKEGISSNRAGAMLAACSGLIEHAEPKSIMSGLPAFPHRQSLREQAALRRLPDLVAQVRKLQEEIEQIRKAMGK